MAQAYGEGEIESLRIELSEMRRSLTSSFRHLTSSFRTDSGLSSGTHDDLNEEALLQWAAIDRLPTFDRTRHSLFEVHEGSESSSKELKVVDVTKLGAPEKHMLIEKLITHIENDNLRLLRKMRKRMDR